MTDYDRKMIAVLRDDNDGNTHVLDLCDLAEREAARAVQA